MPGRAVVAVSAKTGAGPRRAAGGLASAETRGSEPQSATAPTRLYVDRVFTLRGIGTVATGTLWSGSLGAGDAAPRRAGGPRRASAASRCTTGRSSARRRASASRSTSPASSATSSRRGDALVEPRRVPAQLPARRRARRAVAAIPTARGHVHHGTAQIPARVVRVGDRHAQLRLAAPVVAARGDRFVLRAETTLGGGTVLDPAPPRARRRRAARPARAPRRARARPRAGDALAGARPARRRRGARTGVERAGDWLFAPPWLDELRASSQRASPRRIRSTRGSRRDRRHGRPRSSRCSGSSGVARSSTRRARPPLGEREAAAAELEAELERAGYDPVRRGRGARRLPRARGPARARRRRPRARPRGVRAGARRTSSRSASARAGSRSRACATCSGRGAARRSSCSSASTRTGSRAGSATSASSGAGAPSRGHPSS